MSPRISHRDLYEVVEQLLKVSTMTTTEGRERLVAALPRDVAIRIPRRLQSNMDTYAILHTCLNSPGGLQEFFQAIRAISGDSTQLLVLHVIPGPTR
jgi:hypothetical protein